jgi:TrkA domain protein
MVRIEQTALPGVGIRYDFETQEGQRVGIVHHHTGRREVFICPADDPDTAEFTFDLNEDEAHTMVDLLGGSQVVESLAHLQQHIEGLAIDWLAIEDGTPYAGKTIGDARIRTRTGVSVVAALRGKAPHPAPGPEFTVRPGDTLVVVGTPQGIEEVVSILRNG